MYRDPHLNGFGYQTPQIFGFNEIKNKSITTMGDSSGNPFFVLSIDTITDFNFVSPASGGTMTFPVGRYSPDGTRIDNITDWALKEFHKAYGKTPDGRNLNKDAIFHYVYGVLHDPVYRETYAQNLKREFPRNPAVSGVLAMGGLGRGTDGAAHRL
jgi:predicted helicase